MQFWKDDNRIHHAPPRNERRGWGEGILDILGIIFGIILLVNPLIGTAYLPYMLGIFLIIGGIGAIICIFLIRPKT